MTRGQTIWLALLLILGVVFLAAQMARGGSVTLAWDPSPGTNVISHYNIYYGSDSGNYTSVVNAGSALTCTISNLIGATTYYFAATAVDTAGLESDYSSEVSTCIIGTNILVRITSVNATNLQWSQTLSGPWNLIGATNWTGTNMVGPVFARALGPDQFHPGQAFISATPF